MKIFELTASGNPSELDEMIHAIKRDCKPFLSQSKGYRLFRGIRKKEDWFSAYPRLDRRPLSSSDYITKYYNRLIERAGLTANRNNSFFVTSDDDIASLFAPKVYLTFPNGKLLFTWSTRIDDWFNYFEEIENQANETDDQEILDNEMELLFNSLKGNDDSFRAALESGHEIIIQNHCYFINEDVITDTILEEIYEGY